MGSQLIYLATKYSDDDPQEVERNYVFACTMADGLRAEGLIVISPVELFHPVVSHGKAPKNHEMWMAIDLALQKQCDMTVFIARFSPGLAAGNSKGVLEEMNIASIRHPFLTFCITDGDELEDVANICKGVLSYA